MESSKERLSLNITNAQSFYFVLIIVFLVTGFIYNLIFFRLFGIRVELFFSLQDYLSASIEKIYLITISVLVALGSSQVIKYLLKGSNLIGKNKLLTMFLYAMPIVLFAAWFILIRLNNNLNGYYILALAIYICFDYLFFKILFNGNHESYMRFFIGAVIFYIFLLLVLQ